MDRTPKSNVDTTQYPLNDAERQIILEGKLVHAVQAVRRRTGLGLAESRDVVVASPEWQKFKADIPTVRALRFLELAVEKLQTSEKLLMDDQQWTPANEVGAILALLRTLGGRLAELKPPLNQCDGCRAGIPIKDGVHDDGSYAGRSMCTANRYR